MAAKQPNLPLGATQHSTPSHRGLLVATFCMIVMGGSAGAAIAFGLVDIGCHGNCATPRSVAILGGALIGSIGVAVIAVLVLRAMVEWELHQARQQHGP